MSKQNNNSDYIHCPLLKKQIELGLCLDINYERLKYFNTGIIKEIGKTNEAVNTECEKCLNKPL